MIIIDRVVQILLNRKFYGAVAASMLALFLLASGSIAQQAEEDVITLAVSPQILELSANPGDSIENTFRLTNGSSEQMQVAVTPQNFIPQGEDGAVELTDETTNYSLAQWITVDPEQTVINARQTEDFRLTITVPEAAEPGGHFGSLVFRTIPPDQEGSAALVSQEIAPVILVKVAGDVEEGSEIASFQSLKSVWSNQNPIQFETRIRNTGNVHFRPSGQIEVKNMFGTTVERIDLDQQNVIPEAIRRTTTDWDDPGFRFGRYSADLTVIYGDENQILTSQTHFTVFPYQTIAPIALGLGLLIIVVLKFRGRISLALKVLRGKSVDE